MAIPTRTHAPSQPLSQSFPPSQFTSYPQFAPHLQTQQNLTHTMNVNSNQNSQVFMSPPNMNQAFPNQVPNSYSPSSWGMNNLNLGGNPTATGNQQGNAHGNAKFNGIGNRNSNGQIPQLDPTSFAPNMNPVIPNGFAFGAGSGAPASNITPAASGAFSSVAQAGGYQANAAYGGMLFAPPFSQAQAQHPGANDISNNNTRARSRSSPRQHPNPYANSNQHQSQNHDHHYLQSVVYNSPYSTAAAGDANLGDEPPVIPIPNLNGKGFVLLHHQQRRQEGGDGSNSNQGGDSRREEEQTRDEDLQPVPPAYAITGPHPAWASAWTDPNGPFASAVRSKGGERAADPPQPPVMAAQHVSQQQPQQQLNRSSEHHPFHPSFGHSMPPFPAQAPVQPQVPPHGHQQPAPPPGIATPPAHNTTEMTREMLIPVLDRFSELLLDYFDFSEHIAGSSGDDSPGSDGSGSGRERDGQRYRRPRQLRLLAHGGACMLLHPVFRALSLEMPLVGAPMPGAAAGDEMSSLDKLMQQQQGLQNMKMENLARRTTTRDVDVIMRAFADDYSSVRAPERFLQAAAAAYRNHAPAQYAGAYPGYVGYGAPTQPTEQGDDTDPDSPKGAAQLDAVGRLKACIRRTARYFPGLGLDWMNADADVALPLGADPQTHQTFDPIHRTAFTASNIQQYSVYTSPNRRLQLVSVTPVWSIALKIARWGRRDFADVGILLRSATSISGIHWTPEMLQGVLERDCWAMGYSRWDERRKKEFKDRVACAVRMVEGWGSTGTTVQGHASDQMNGYGYGSVYGQAGGNELGLYMHSHTAQGPVQGQQRSGPVPGVQQQQQLQQLQQQPQQQSPPRDVRDWERGEARAARMASAQERRQRSRSRHRSAMGSGSRSKSRARSQSIGPNEIFIPPDDEEDEAYQQGFQYEEVADWRGRGQPRHISRSIPVGSGGGHTSGTTSTAVAPFHRNPPQHIAHTTGTHGPRLWRRRSTSRSRNNNDRERKAKQRDRERRLDQQRRYEERSGWVMPPIVPFDSDSGSGSEEASESAEDTDDTDDEEQDKENRDRASAWRQANIYGPSKKRPTPLNMPAPLTNEQAVRQHPQRESRQSLPVHGTHHSAYSQQIQPNPHQQHQRQLSRTQSHPHLLSQSQHQAQPGPNPTPYPTPQPEPPSTILPNNANPAQLAQFQFEQQMRLLEHERQYEQSVKDMMNRIAKRIVTRGSTL